MAKINVNNLIHYVAPWNRFLFGEYDEKNVISTGGRSSKKSTDFIINLIWESFQDSDNILILRGTFNSHKETTYADFCKWIANFKLEKHFDFNMSNLTITNKITGGKILFKGADNPKAVHRLKGIIELKRCFIEEANIGITQEIYRVINGTMRNTKKEKKIFMAYNPLNPFTCPWKEWIDEPELFNCIHIHSTYLDNPFNSQDFLDDYEHLKKTNPRLYKTEALGEYGVYENAILDETKIVEITETIFSSIKKRGWYQGLGMDFGCTHPQTFSRVFYDKSKNDLYIAFSEGESNLTNMKFIRKYLDPKDNLKVLPNKFADSEDKSARIELNDEGWDFVGAYKRDMENTFIQFFNNLNRCYIVKGKCDGFKSNVASWCWKNGSPEDKNDDYIDSVRYGLEPIIKEKLGKGSIKAFSHELY